MIWKKCNSVSQMSKNVKFVCCGDALKSEDMQLLQKQWRVNSSDLPIIGYNVEMKNGYIKVSMGPRYTNNLIFYGDDGEIKEYVKSEFSEFDFNKIRQPPQDRKALVAWYRRTFQSDFIKWCSLNYPSNVESILSEWPIERIIPEFDHWVALFPELDYTVPLEQWYNSNWGSQCCYPPINVVKDKFSGYWFNTYGGWPKELLQGLSKEFPHVGIWLEYLHQSVGFSLWEHGAYLIYRGDFLYINEYDKRDALMYMPDIVFNGVEDYDLYDSHFREKYVDCKSR